MDESISEHQVEVVVKLTVHVDADSRYNKALVGEDGNARLTALSFVGAVLAMTDEFKEKKWGNTYVGNTFISGEDVIKPGDRVKITAYGQTVVGKCDTVYRSNGGQYGIEMTSEAGRYYYWKQWQDGGSVEKIY